MANAHERKEDDEDDITGQRWIVLVVSELFLVLVRHDCVGRDQRFGLLN